MFAKENRSMWTSDVFVSFHQMDCKHGGMHVHLIE